jgi:hypothetical protein
VSPTVTLTATTTSVLPTATATLYQFLLQVADGSPYAGQYIKPQTPGVSTSLDVRLTSDTTAAGIFAFNIDGNTPTTLYETRHGYHLTQSSSFGTRFYLSTNAYERGNLGAPGVCQLMAGVLSCTDHGNTVLEVCGSSPLILNLSSQVDSGCSAITLNAVEMQ